LTEDFKADTDPRVTFVFVRGADGEKVSLGVGAYRDDNGKPYVLSAVHKAEQLILQKKYDKGTRLRGKGVIVEYAPITGFPEYGKLVSALVFGEYNSPNIAIVQALSGTGGLRVGGEFLKRFWPNKTIYIPAPTWPNHPQVFRSSDLNVKTYRYYDPTNIALDINGLLEDLGQAERGSTLLLHACAHNPTGVDPMQEQWRQIARVVKERDLLVFFDAAYLGFASGDYNADAFSIRYFLSQGITILLALSFAKNMVHVRGRGSDVGIVWGESGGVCGGLS
jgi:aspartate aminotransferase, mitochondrial